MLRMMPSGFYEEVDLPEDNPPVPETPKLVLVVNNEQLDATAVKFIKINSGLIKEINRLQGDCQLLTHYVKDISYSNEKLKYKLEIRDRQIEKLKKDLEKVTEIKPVERKKRTLKKKPGRPAKKKE